MCGIFRSAVVSCEAENLTQQQDVKQCTGIQCCLPKTDGRYDQIPSDTAKYNAILGREVRNSLRSCGLTETLLLRYLLANFCAVYFQYIDQC